MVNSSPCLWLLPHRKPPCLFPDPEMADSCPWSHAGWPRSLVASWPIPVPRARPGQFLFPERKLANSDPGSCASRCCSRVTRWLILFPDSNMADSCPWMGLLPHRQPLFLFPDPEIADSSLSLSGDISLGRFSFTFLLHLSIPPATLCPLRPQYLI